MNYRIEEMIGTDWERVKEICLEGINTGIVTFETGAPTWEKWNSGHLQHSRLVVR